MPCTNIETVITVFGISSRRPKILVVTRCARIFDGTSGTTRCQFFMVPDGWMRDGFQPSPTGVIRQHMSFITTTLILVIPQNQHGGQMSTNHQIGGVFLPTSIFTAVPVLKMRV